MRQWSFRFRQMQMQVGRVGVWLFIGCGSRYKYGIKIVRQRYYYHDNSNNDNVRLLNKVVLCSFDARVARALSLLCFSPMSRRSTFTRFRLDSCNINILAVHLPKVLSNVSYADQSTRVTDSLRRPQPTALIQTHLPTYPLHLTSSIFNRPSRCLPRNTVSIM
jgi:hypothetical protein